MTWKTRVLKMVAGLRRFVRRASRHMIRIRIENTIRPFVQDIDIEESAAPAGSVPSMAPTCVICARNPQQIARLCFACRYMPKYLIRCLAQEPFATAQDKVHAWQDAAPNN